MARNWCLSFVVDYLNSVQVTENVVKTSTAPIANNELTSAKRTDSNPHEPMIVPKTIDSEQQSHKMSQNATNQVNGTAIGDIESVATDDDTARVNISKQSINTILIGNCAHQSHFQLLAIFDSLICFIFSHYNCGVNWLTHRHYLPNRLLWHQNKNVSIPTKTGANRSSTASRRSAPQ